MSKILYIGNKSPKNIVFCAIDTLSLQLSEFCEVITVSDKQNKVLRLMEMVLSVFRYRKVDYILIDTFSTSAFYFSYVVSMVCRALHKKYIPILRGGSLPERLEQSPRLSDNLFNHSYVNVSPSEYLNYEFKKHGVENVITIPNNIKIDDYTFKRRTTFKSSLLWVRSFDKTYNCEMAVEVLRLLLQHYPNTKLCMVGPDKDGSMQRVKDLATQYGIMEKLTITGKLSKGEWHKLSEDYDIFISTTDFDNTPVSVIEAMALGLPVVSTRVGGVPYLLEDGHDALLCEKGNATDMVEKIVHIISSPENSIQICSNARQKVEAFDWEVVKEQWKNLLK